MTRPVVETALEVCAFVLLVAALAYQPPSAGYGVEAERLNESAYFDRWVENLSDLPPERREGVRDAIEEGHGQIPGTIESDADLIVRHEGAVYRVGVTSVADPGPRPPWGFATGATGGVLLGVRSLFWYARQRG